MEIEKGRDSVNIVFVSSEVTPFAKTGGLADVCGVLPSALARLGHNVSVIMPAYRQIADAHTPIESTGLPLCVPVGDKEVWGAILKSRLPNSDVPIYFMQHDHYFHRDGLYNSGGIDYQDNCERFVFFCRAVFSAIEQLGLAPDILHANDWQTGLIPAYLNTIYRKERKLHEQTNFFGGDLLHGSRENADLSSETASVWEKVRTVFTIHNMRYQGRFWHWDMRLTGIDWRYFTYDKMEFYGQLNLLKTGIIFADAITTVSPEYAKEIQTEGFGEKLQGVLRYRNSALSGILNGIDTAEWNPATDPAIAANFDETTVFENKPKCKSALQREFGLDENPNAPLFGIVSRFDPQKGLDLAADVIPRWVERAGAQFAILGTGERELEDRFLALAGRYPKNVSAHIRFEPALSHRIEAGCDLFLMPSRYEPCGLNQMYSQRYGTLPIVRKTGGLADTVVAASDETLAAGTATGFSFVWANTDDLDKVIDWAVHCWFDRKEDWRKMVLAALRTDHSWNRSALAYEALYKRTLGLTTATENKD